MSRRLFYSRFEIGLCGCSCGLPHRGMTRAGSANQPIPGFPATFFSFGVFSLAKRALSERRR